jgi:membrane fusion protein, heavy metal efflux system
VLDPTIRTAKVRLEVANPGLMRVGMFVTATFYGKQAETRGGSGDCDSALARPRVGLTRRWARDTFKRLEVVTGKMLPGNMQEIVSGHQAGRSGGFERAATAKHGGAIDDSQSR